MQHHSEIMKIRLTVDWVDEKDQLTLRCEVAGTEEGLEKSIADSLREHCKLRGEIELVEVGSLPNDGIVIEDVRKYD